ncbi:hypothetical protein CDAR_208621 [Caerostris darwini]|uniref:Uncharacterized protein n=1 Tax=Caerostris darwini TaxID=1538125 RepID=A0AAV4VQ59_9ARAC|nr:hypothetical protein CDAR_208621 [Caerostris darwini]
MMGNMGYLEPQVYCSARDIELAPRKISDSSDRSINAASGGDFGSWLAAAKESSTRQGRRHVSGEKIPFSLDMRSHSEGEREPPCEQRSNCPDDGGNGISGAAGPLLGVRY